MNFSIILPSRERSLLLKAFLQSIQDNTENLNNIEVLIALDDDDKRTNYSFLEFFSFVRSFRVRRSPNFSKDYYNFLASHSTGRWVICANDDSRFETKNWDKIAYGVLEGLSGVIYGFIEDGMEGYRVTQHGEYCSFPLIGRTGYETLGYIFPDRIPVWGANLWVKYLYESIGSVVKLPILVRHYTHRNKTREIDHINERIARNQTFAHPRYTTAEHDKLLAKLKEHEITGARI